MRCRSCLTHAYFYCCFPYPRLFSFACCMAPTPAGANADTIDNRGERKWLPRRGWLHCVFQIEEKQDAALAIAAIDIPNNCFLSPPQIRRQPARKARSSKSSIATSQRSKSAVSSLCFKCPGSEGRREAHHTKLTSQRKWGSNDEGCRLSWQEFSNARSAL